jgi:hypothetical protein
VKRAIILFVAAILGGCATGTTRVGGSDLSAEPRRAQLLGEPGEKSGHFYARVLTRVCAGSEDDDLVAQVADALASCKGPRLDCERATCESVHPSEQSRCDSLALARATAIDQMRAELEAIARARR